MGELFPRVLFVAALECLKARLVAAGSGVNLSQGLQFLTGPFLGATHPSVLGVDTDLIDFSGRMYD